jgi:hypothetical protein
LQHWDNQEEFRLPEEGKRRSVRDTALAELNRGLAQLRKMMGKGRILVEEREIKTCLARTLGMDGNLAIVILAA